MKSKFLLKIILLLSLATPKLFADITQAQLDKYMGVSRGGQALAYYQRKLIKEFSNLVEVKYRAQVINKLKVILNSKEVLENFNKKFMDLNKSTYSIMMKFYNTKEGTNSVNITANFSLLNKEEMNIIFQKCKINHTKDCLKHIDLTKFNSLPKNQKTLLKKIAQKFDIIRIKRNFSKQSILAMNLVYQKEYQYSNDFIKAYSTFNDPEYNKTTSKISYLFFKDFREDELEKIVDYALSDAGQQEYKLIEEGITAYTNEFIKRVLILYSPDKCNIQTDSSPKK